MSAMGSNQTFTAKVVNLCKESPASLCCRGAVSVFSVRQAFGCAFVHDAVAPCAGPETLTNLKFRKLSS